jgi:ABC-2 type transport system permease protein
MRAALVVEGRKALAAPAVRWTLAALVAGTAVLAAAFALAVRTGDTRIIAKLGAAGSAPGWPGLLSGATQVAAAGSLLAVGVVASWVVGREFSEGRIGGLFGLATDRRQIASAKLAVVLAGALAAAVAVVASVVLDGMLLGFGSPSVDDVAALLRLALLVALAGPLVVPCAWAATLGRGLLPGIGLAVALLAGTQVLVVVGAGSWFPWAAPALWAVDPASVPPWALAGALVVGLAGWAALARSWGRLQVAG